MASSETVARRTASASAGALEAWWVTALGWLFPGLGYFLSGKWVRGGLVLACVVGMFGLGLALQGHVYAFNTGDVLAILGWVGDACAGVLYFFTRLAGGGAGNPYAIMGDYGTNFLIAAGLLNLLAAADARDIFVGKKR